MRTPLIEPEPSRWAISLEGARPGEDLVAVGADLEPGTILGAYRAGLFPMGLGRNGGRPLGWWAPDPRGVLLPGGLKVSRSLRRSVRRFRISADQAFSDVVAGCADPRRDGRWITPEIAAAYTRLHELGWAHSIEVRDSGDRLVGGLYGLAIGGLFAGESMFHHVPDASKVALVALVERFHRDGDRRRLVDAQWYTPHLASLGVVQVPRARYAELLGEALAVPEANLDLTSDPA